MSRPGRFELPRVQRTSKEFVELMAGSRVLSRAFRGAGAPSRSYERGDDPLEDCMHPQLDRDLDAKIDRDEVLMIWMGLVCSTWSLAARGLYRGLGHLWGKPDLTPAQQARVLDGNRQARWGVRRFLACARRGVACAIENPLSSYLWKTPAFRKLLARFPSVVVHYCAFGCQYRKPTQIVYCHCDLSPLRMRVCRRPNGVCEYTGRKHVQLMLFGEPGSAKHSTKPPSGLALS